MFVLSHWISLNLKMSQSSESDTKLLWFLDEFIFRAAAEALHQTPFKKRQIIISVWIHPKANNISWGLVLLASLKTWSEPKQHLQCKQYVYLLNKRKIIFYDWTFFKSNIKMLFLFLFIVCSLLLLFVFCQFFVLLCFMLLFSLFLSSSVVQAASPVEPPNSSVSVSVSPCWTCSAASVPSRCPSGCRCVSTTASKYDMRWRWDAGLVVVSSR